MTWLARVALAFFIAALWSGAYMAIVKLSGVDPALIAVAMLATLGAKAGVEFDA